MDYVDRWRVGLVALGAVAALVLATDCSPGDTSSPARTSRPGATPADNQAGTTPGSPTPDAATVKANELGVVPVLMYHRLVAQPTGEFDRRPEDFRAELQQLFDQGYRPVTAAELAERRLDVPAGTTPVVLTFDDSTRDQFALRPDGSVDPATAVGILLDFGRTHPGFRAVATMYVNADPFGVRDGGPLLHKLQELGIEVGDHTSSHANLAKLDAVGVGRELVLGQRVVTGATGQAPRTMALPFGVRPADGALAGAGSWDGESYSFKAVFLVGAAPAPSPFAGTFDPLAVPRIRSSSWAGGPPNFGSAYWLDWLAKHPDKRYVADGNPDAVSFPTAERPRLAPAFEARARPY